MTPPAVPPVQEFRQKGMHRLIPSRFSETGTVLEEVTTDAAMLADAARLDAATNERIQGELHGLSGISHFELVYGIPYEEWKAKYQREASPQQRAAFEAGSHKH